MCVCVFVCVCVPAECCFVTVFLSLLYSHVLTSHVVLFALDLHCSSLNL